MMPPECEICGKRFDPFSGNAGLVAFEMRESDREWHKKMDEEGFTGHPPEQVWFCEDHYQAADKLSHLTKPEALKLLRQ